MWVIQNRLFHRVSRNVKHSGIPGGLMLSIVVVGYGMILMGLSEITIGLWFLWAWVDYRKGQPIKKHSVLFPIAHLLLTIGISWLVFRMDTYFLSESIIPVKERLASALRLFGLLNLTTPLFQ